MGFPLRDFRVFYDSWLTVLEDNEADWFVWGTFTNYLSCDIQVVGETVAYEGWVCDADETIIYAVCVDVLDVATLKVV